jgi:hypothetical protein
MKLTKLSAALLCGCRALLVERRRLVPASARMNTSTASQLIASSATQEQWFSGLF